jgi:hypothetical protein
MQDLNAFEIESAMKMVAGTARSMGITVTGKLPGQLKSIRWQSNKKQKEVSKIRPEKSTAWKMQPNW